MRPTVAYASFCCPKDRDRALGSYTKHLDSHKYAFDERLFIFQRCAKGKFKDVKMVEIKDEDYQKIMDDYGIKYPDPVLDELTHGWGAPHFWAHHCVNHLRAAQVAYSDYIVFADADCYMTGSPEKSWVEEGIRILETDPRAFVVSPNDGGMERSEHIMSQQMFLMRRIDLIKMIFIPWDGTFIQGGPFQEYYGLMEGWIGRFMMKNGLYRYVLPSQWRYWHGQWH